MREPTVPLHPRARALVVEDDLAVSGWVRRVLTDDGFDVTVALGETSAKATITTMAFALAVIDVPLPDGSGLSVVRALRQSGQHTAIVLLSSHADDVHMMDGFDAGADDYVTKPVSAAILLARVRAVLRRHSTPARIQAGDLSLDGTSRQLTGDNGTVGLTKKESQLLVSLIMHNGQLMTRMALFADIWGYDFDPGTSVLDVTIMRLRQKLGVVSTLATIRSIRNAGLLFSCHRPDIGHAAST